MNRHSQSLQERADDLRALDLPLHVHYDESEPGKLLILGTYSGSKNEAERKAEVIADVLDFGLFPRPSQERVTLPLYSEDGEDMGYGDIALFVRDLAATREVLVRAGVDGVFNLPPSSEVTRQVAAKRQQVDAEAEVEKKRLIAAALDRDDEVEHELRLSR